MTTSKTLDLLRRTVALKGRAGVSLTAAIAFAVALSMTSVDVSAQIIFTETFDTTTSRDPATTADWDTASGNLRLPLTTSAAPINSLAGSFLATATSSPIDLGETISTRDVAVGDLDGDGDLDLAFANDGKNSVYFNNGAAVFVRGADIPDDYFSGSNSRSVEIADFNGDGFLDVVYAEFGNGQATRIHFNNGSGSTSVFTAGDFVDLGEPTINGDSVAVGDIDNDGTIDVVLGVRGDFVKVFRNDGFGNFGAPEDVVDPAGSAAYRARSVLLGDLDADGDLDIVAALETDDTRVYLNDGTGSFGAPQSVGGGVSNSLNAPDTIDLGDVNGDGLLDLIVGNDNVGSPTLPPPQPNRLYLNSGNAAALFPSVSFSFADGIVTNAAHFVDVDRDGDLDIVAAAFAVGNGVTTPGADRLYLNDGTGTFPANGTVITGDIDVSKSVASGDFDGDGDLDLVYANDPGTGAPFSTAENKYVENVGSATGPAANQVFATGLSLQMAPGAFLDNGVILRPNSNNTEANVVFEYWLSNDGGTSWIAAQPFRSVSFPDPTPPGGADLRWRVEMDTPSPTLRPDLGQLRLTTNRAPSIDSTAVTAATQDVEYTYTILTSDPDGEAIDITASVLPTWLTLTDNGDTTATLVGTPTNANVGTVGNDVTLEVRDTAGLSDTQTFTIDVTDANDPPVLVPALIGTGDQTYTQGDVVTLDTSTGFSDPDLDVLTYSATGLPPSLALDPNTGVISGTLTNDDAVAGPDFSVVVTADDGNGGTVDDDFTITVNNINDAPSFTSTPITAATEGAAYTYSIVAEDIDGDTVTITSGALPAWLTLSATGPGTAQLSGTPAASDVGQVNVTLTVSDGSIPVDQSFSITVAAAAPSDTTPPVITLVGSANVSLTVGGAYTEQGATATDDVDGDLTSSIVIGGDTVDTGTAGTYTITYNVSDAAGNAAAEVTRTVVVSAAPPPPPPPPPSGGGGGGAFSLPGLLLLFGLMYGIRRREPHSA